MIKKDTAPVGWAMLMFELTDAQEHLAKLVENLDNDPGYDEGDFRVELGHVYSHLNRAWHRRNTSEDLQEDEWDAAGQFPKDLEPT